MESRTAVRTQGWKGREQWMGIEGKRMSTCLGMLLFKFMGGGRGDGSCNGEEDGRVRDGAPGKLTRGGGEEAPRQDAAAGVRFVRCERWGC
jgi:hypothetical protein